MLSTQERINNVESPIARELLQGLYDALAEAILIPNEYLPEHLQQHKEWDLDDNGNRFYGNTPAEINRKLESMKNAR